MIALWTAAALAATPEVTADDWRISWAPTDAVSVMGARRLQGGAAGAQLVWSHLPLLYLTDSGEETAIVRELVTAHLGGAWGTGGLLVGVDVPLHVLRTSDLDPLRVALPGDPAVDVAWVAVDKPLGGVAARGRRTLPLGAAQWQLGQPGPTAEVGLSGELHLGRLGLAADLGRRFAPGVDLPELSWKDRWWAQAALMVPMGRPVWASLEIRTALPGNLRVQPVNTSLEGLLAVHGRHQATVIHGGVAWAGAPGIGVPSFRLFAGVRWGPPRDEVLATPADE